jgi:hypothetical protein
MVGATHGMTHGTTVAPDVRLAAALHAAGVRAGHRISLLLEPGPVRGAVVAAAFRLGAVVVAASPALGERAAADAHAAAEPDVVVADRRGLRVARRLRTPFLRVATERRRLAVSGSVPVQDLVGRHLLVALPAAPDPQGDAALLFAASDTPCEGPLGVHWTRADLADLAAPSARTAQSAQPAVAPHDGPPRRGGPRAATLALANELVASVAGGQHQAGFGQLVGRVHEHAPQGQHETPADGAARVLRDLRGEDALDHREEQAHVVDGHVGPHPATRAGVVERTGEQGGGAALDRREAGVARVGGVHGGEQARGIDLQRADLGDQVLEQPLRGQSGDVLLQGLDARGVDGLDQGGAVGEVPVERAPADARALGDPVERDGGTGLAEHALGRGDDPRPVPDRVPSLAHPAESRGRRRAGPRRLSAAR